MQNFNLKKKAIQPFGYSRQIMSAILLLVTILFWLPAGAQTYTSNFPDPTGHYSVSSPSGGILCLAPSVTNASELADADPNNYASVRSLVAVTLTCTNSTTYSLRTKLNFHGGATFAPAGYEAGFRLSLGNILSANVGTNLTIRTYLQGSLRETKPGSSLIGISLLTTTNPVNLYFTTTQSFDEVELVFNTAIIPLNLGFDYRFYYAYGAPSGVLPVSFSGVTAKLQSGRLQVDWSTISETNNAKFIVQGSSDGKTWTDLGSVDTKAVGGQSSTTLTYSFSKQWGNTILAGFGILGLLLLPAVRNRLMRLALILLVVSVAISCAKEKDSFKGLDGNESGSQPVYIRVAQIDKDGTATYSEVVLAKK